MPAGGLTMKFCCDLPPGNTATGEVGVKGWGLSNSFLHKYKLMHLKESNRQLSWDNSMCAMESKDLVAKPLQNVRLRSVLRNWQRAGRRDFPDNPGEFPSHGLKIQVTKRENTLSGVTVEAFPWM